MVISVTGPGLDQFSLGVFFIIINPWHIDLNLTIPKLCFL